jgi:spore maturation protein A
MLNYIWAFMLLVGIIYGAWSGNISEVSTAVLDSSVQAVELVISMAGVVALWCGLMEIADNAGIVKLLSKGLRPVVLWLFPGLRREKGEKAVEYITLNFIMNMLGTGWSATGPGLMAMEELNRLKCSDSQINVDTASDEMCTFLVMNISSLQLIPVNIIAYRRAYGSVEPAKIVIPALIATSISTVAAVIFCKIMCKCRSA